jgi:hypothetical protein
MRRLDRDPAVFAAEEGALMAQPVPVVKRNEPALLGSVFLTTDLKAG